MKLSAFLKTVMFLSFFGNTNGDKPNLSILSGAFDDGNNVTLQCAVDIFNSSITWFFSDAASRISICYTSGLCIPNIYGFDHSYTFQGNASANVAYMHIRPVNRTTMKDRNYTCSFSGITDVMLPVITDLPDIMRISDLAGNVSVESDCGYPAAQIKIEWHYMEENAMNEVFYSSDSKPIVKHNNCTQSMDERVVSTFRPTAGTKKVRFKAKATYSTSQGTSFGFYDSWAVWSTLSESSYFIAGTDALEKISDLSKDKTIAIGLGGGGGIIILAVILVFVHRRKSLKRSNDSRSVQLTSPNKSITQEQHSSSL